MAASVDDWELREWSECRATIARMDTILEDLRKFGFSLVTGLLTASAFLAGTARPEAAVASFVAVMVLVTTLFSVDTYYSASMSGAVERALDVEARRQPPILLTRTIHTNCHRASVVWVTLGLYLGLLVVALGMCLITASSTHQFTLVAAPAVFGIGLIGYMVTYWNHVNRQANMSRMKDRSWHDEPSSTPGTPTAGEATQAMPTTAPAGPAA